MRIISETARGAWLADRAGSWATVGGVAGTGFEAYARILHPVGAELADLSTTDEWGHHPVLEEATWTWSQVAERTGRVMHPLVQYRRLTTDETLLDYPDGWGVSPSSEGWLDPDLLAALTRHLVTTTPDDVVVGIWNGWGLPDAGQAYVSFAMATDGGDDGDDEEPAEWHADFERMQRERAASVSKEFRAAIDNGPHFEYPNRSFVLLQSSLSELSNPGWGYGAGIGWTTNSPEPAPQLVWPEDHAWVVATEIDWDSTVVAGTREVVDAILRDPTYETFEVHEGDELSWEGDLINPAIG